jgi:hypothetical protein
MNRWLGTNTNTPWEHRGGGPKGLSPCMRVGRRGHTFTCLPDKYQTSSTKPRAAFRRRGSCSSELAALMGLASHPCGRVSARRSRGTAAAYCREGTPPAWHTHARLVSHAASLHRPPSAANDTQACVQPRALRNLSISTMASGSHSRTNADALGNAAPVIHANCAPPSNVIPNPPPQRTAAVRESHRAKSAMSSTTTTVDGSAHVDGEIHPCSRFFQGLREVPVRRPRRWWHCGRCPPTRAAAPAAATAPATRTPPPHPPPRPACRCEGRTPASAAERAPPRTTVTALRRGAPRCSNRLKHHHRPSGRPVAGTVSRRVSRSQHCGKPPTIMSNIIIAPIAL